MLDKKNLTVNDKNHKKMVSSREQQLEIEGIFTLEDCWYLATKYFKYKLLMEDS